MPDRVAVVGPKSLLESIDNLGTDAFDIQGLQGTREGVVAVQVDTTQGIQLSRERVVRVRVTTKPAKKRRR